MTRRVVYGGGFDPPTQAHRMIARAAAAELDADELVIVPTGAPSHKQASMLPADVRVALCQAAFGEIPGATISRIELDRVGPSYTQDTLQALSEPGVELWLVLGADQVAALPTWQNAERVRELARLCSVARPGITYPAAADHVLSVMPPDVSSTTVRELLGAGRPTTGLLPRRVGELCRELSLYAA